MGASWKTSVLGWAGLVAAAALAVKGFVGGGAEGVDWTGIWDALIVVFPSLAAIFARDNNVSSEEANGEWEYEEAE